MASVVSPRRTMRNEKRSEILTRKVSSPKIRDILRERCRERMQNNRDEILGKLRNVTIQDNIRNIVANIVHEEWMDVCTSSSSQDCSLPSSQDFNIENELVWEDDLEQELLSEQEHLLLEEYEAMLATEEREITTVLCPVCLHGSFQSSFNKLACMNCKISFPSVKTLTELHNDIFKNIAIHSQHCNKNVQFVVVTENVSKSELCILCHSCSFLNVLL